MVRDDGVVPAVRLPEDVEDVARDGHRAEAGIEGDVEQHARELALRQAKLRRLPDEPERDERRGTVADAGNETDQAVEPEADVRAGNRDGAVEEIGDAAESREPPIGLGRGRGGSQRTMRQLPSGWRQAVP
jgi:hypothetical protein